MKLYLTKLVWLPIILFIISCGEMEDTPTPIKYETDPLLRIASVVEKLENLEIGVPRDWENTRDPIERAAYTRHLLSLGRLPVILDLNDIYTHTDDLIILTEHFRASLIKRFGDVQQVHVVSDYRLKRVFNIVLTDEEIKAVVQAHNYLFPENPIKGTDPKQIPFFHKRTHYEEQRAVAKIRKEDPEAWTEHNRVLLIKKYGDIPDVHIVADFMEKIELGISIKKNEYENYLAILEELQPGWFTQNQFYVKLEAEFQLGIWHQDLNKCKLELYRWAKADAIPLNQINMSNINEEGGFCQSLK